VGVLNSRFQGGGTTFTVSLPADPRTATPLEAPAEVIGFIGNAVGTEAVGIIGNQRFIQKAPLLKHVEALLK